MSPVNAQTDFGDALDDTWDEKLTGFLNKVASQPYKYDYFSLLRQLESVKFVTGGKLLGKAVSPKMEKIRIRQEPSLIFAPRNIQSVALSPRYVEISINGFGLFGPSGPLPLHLTEYAYERQHQHGDRTWTGFANMLQHRLAVLFYRAWANAQSIISLDKNAEDRFGKYIASFNGLDTPAIHNKGLIHEFAKRYFAGLLMKQSRSAANLQQLLNRYFKVPVTIQTNVGYWVEVAGRPGGGRPQHVHPGQGARAGLPLRERRPVLTLGGSVAGVVATATDPGRLPGRGLPRRQALRAFGVRRACRAAPAG